MTTQLNDQILFGTLVGFDCGGFVVDVGDGPGFSGLIVGNSAIAFGPAFGLSFLTDGHAGLELAHTGLDLVLVDDGPGGFGPVVVDGVGIVVVKEEVGEVLLLRAVDGADGGGVEVWAAWQSENREDLTRAVRNAVVDCGGRDGFDDFFDVEALRRGEHTGQFREVDAIGVVGKILHGIAVLHPDAGVLELGDVGKGGGEDHAHLGEVIR